jgi:GNAT superfamily N-acetyltransferase
VLRGTFICVLLSKHDLISQYIACTDID